MAILPRYLIERDIPGVNEELIRKHAELSGIPITRIIEVPQIIDPLTANN